MRCLKSRLDIVKHDLEAFFKIFNLKSLCVSIFTAIDVSLHRKYARHGMLQSVKIREDID